MCLRIVGAPQAQRFTSIVASDKAVVVGLIGSQGEEVTIAVWNGKEVVQKPATIGNDGTATISFTAA